MTNSQRLAAVRRCLDRWLEAQHHDEDIDIRDAVLIRGGFYVGRKFELGTFRAVWFMEEDEVKIHDASGSMVAKFSAAEIDQASMPFVAQALPQPAVAVAMKPEALSREDDVATIRMQRTPSPSESLSASERGNAAESSETTHSQPIRRAA